MCEGLIKFSIYLQTPEKKNKLKLKKKAAKVQEDEVQSTLKTK